LWAVACDVLVCLAVLGVPRINAILAGEFGRVLGGLLVGVIRELGCSPESAQRIEAPGSVLLDVPSAAILEERSGVGVGPVVGDRVNLFVRCVRSRASWQLHQSTEPT